MEIWFVLGILAIATVVFISNRLRADLVALLVLVVLGLSGILTQSEAFSGFGSSSVIVILAAFIITGAIHQTGLGQRLGNLLLLLAGSSPRRLLVLLVFAAGTLSLFMNNIAAAAVLMPIAMNSARRMKISPTKILLPVAFGTQLGGMATLLTTSNVVVASVLHNQGLPSLDILSFLKVGSPIALVSLIILVILAPRLLPQASDNATLFADEVERASLTALYDLEHGVGAARVFPSSPLIGSSLAKSGLRQKPGLNISAIVRQHGQVLRAPTSEEEIQAGDLLLYTPAHAEETLSPLGLQAQSVEDWHEYLVGPRTRLVEVVIGPHSTLEGKTLRQVQFRNRYNMNVLAIWQNGQPKREKLEDIPLRIGDALLLQGRREFFGLLASGTDLIFLSEENLAAPRRRKEWIALGIIVFTLAIAVANWLPVGEVLFAGALALILAGCISIEEAYASIDWRSAFLVGGMLPMGIALTKTGAADWMANYLTGTLASLGPLVVLAGFFILTAILTQFIPGGSATPLVIAPVAITAAQQMGADPRAFAMAVALATSTSLLTPMAHPVNALVMGPGGYRPRDYLRLGFPLLLLVLILTLWLVPAFFPF